MPDKHQLKKLSNKEVDDLKGKLVEVRRIGTNPIFIEVLKVDTIKKALEKADIPGQENELKVEATKVGSSAWNVVKMSDKAYLFSKIAVTTKVSGA